MDYTISIEQIKAAVDTYRHNPTRHTEMIRTAMSLEASWDTSAGQYVNMYRYGLLVKQWQREREALIKKFGTSLKKDRAMFTEFFIPASAEYRDNFDWALKEFLQKQDDPTK